MNQTLTYYLLKSIRIETSYSCPTCKSWYNYSMFRLRIRLNYAEHDEYKGCVGKVILRYHLRDA